MVSPQPVCTDSVRQSDTIWSQRSGSGRFRTPDTSLCRAHLGSATDPERRCCQRRKSNESFSTQGAGGGKEEEWEGRWLPGFAVGGDTLTSMKDFPTVHAGAVFNGHTVSSVVFVVVMWAVASAVTAHVIVLRGKHSSRGSQ